MATLGLVALNGFFVAAEFAAVGARASRLELNADRSFFSRLALEIKHKVDLYLSTCQFGITVASLGLGAVTEPAIAGLLEPVIELFGLVPPPGGHHVLAIGIALFIATALHVVVGEVAPKNFAIFFPDRVLPIVAPPLILFTYAFYPLIWTLNSASNLLLRMVGVKLQHDAHGGIPHTEDELRGLLRQAAASGELEREKVQIVRGAFDLGKLIVRQIMTPRTEVNYLRVGRPLAEVLKRIQQSAYSRLPLCDPDIDHVVGVVHMKDLFTQLNLVPGKLRFTDEQTPEGETVAIAGGKPGGGVHVIGSGDIDLLTIQREVIFVPELLPAQKLLRQFQETQLHMAIVVDEYGSTQGIITLEDVLEQIVGEIEDEFDIAALDFIKEGDGYRVSGRFPLHELREKLQLPEPETEGIDTIGGYITHLLKRWPRVNDVIAIGEYEATVLTVSKRRVVQAMLQRKQPDDRQPDGQEREARER